MNHDMVHKTKGETEYDQCRLCNKVYIKGDNWFNTYCLVKAERQHKLKEELEKGEGKG